MSVSPLPDGLTAGPWGERLRAAVEAVTSAGAALVSLRGAPVKGQELGSQLKTAVDLAAEGWVLGLLEGSFTGDRFLAEERHAAGRGLTPGDEPFWTVDALDGTRSYVEGYPGFCVQVAYVDRGRPVFGAVAEPVAGKCYVALEGAGAHVIDVASGQCTRLPRRSLATWPAGPRFVDSTPPGGAVGALATRLGAVHVECGSVGLKACRVAASQADVYAKAFAFRLWDVAPIEMLLRETGAALRLWSGQPIDYSGDTVEFRNLCAAPEGLMSGLIEHLKGHSS
jgi:3'(2'), 5'-bisphosphate nucleotidase